MACPCRRAASCQLCTGKSHGGTLLPLVKNTRNKIRHTHLSPSAYSMKIVASISPKTSKVVVAKMTKPSTKAKKAKSENEAPLPGGSLSPKPNIMYIEANRYTENTTLPHSNLYTMNAFSFSLPRVRNALKPPHIWVVSIDGQHSKVYCKSPRLCVMPFSRSAQGEKNISTIASPTSRDCRAEAAATAPQRVHGSQCELHKPPNLLHPSTQKAASRTAKKANAQGG